MGISLPVLGVPDVLDGGQGIAWLLLDRFSTDRAAGAVNGTAAEPGPGTRLTTEIDGGEVSISGGDVIVDGNDGGLYDTTFGYDTTGIDVSRVRGKAFLSNGLLENSSGGYYLSVRGYFDTGLFLLANRVEYKDAPGIPSIRVSDKENTDQVYEHVILMRTTGNFCLRDGKLLYVGRDDTDGYSLAAIVSVATDGYYFHLSDARLVQLAATDPTLYPIPVLSDSFNRANGALGSTDGQGHEEGQTTPQGDGVAYSNASTWTISSNAATNTPSVAADNLCYANGGDAEVYHSVEITRNAGEAGIVINAADTSNFIYIVHDGTNVITTEVVSGTPNVLSTVAATYAAGARLEARRIGTAVRVFYNGAFVVEVTPNVALQNNTAHGLYSDSSGNTFDDLETWPTTGFDYTEYA